MKNRRAAPDSRRTRQRGVVLIIALLVLVAMALAGIALVRSVDVTTQVAGNLAFRQSGVQASDAGVEQALQWLMTTSKTDVEVNRPNNERLLYKDTWPSYYASWNGGSSGPVFDPADFNWKSAEDNELQEGSTGNKIRYVIHRMCEGPGAPSTDTYCITAPAVSSGESNRSAAGGDYQCAGNLCSESYQPYYRITVRVEGPRNTVTYTQTVVY